MREVFLTGRLNTMGEITLDSSTLFNLDATLGCGQTFKWEKHGVWWYGVVGETAFKVRQNGEKLEFENADERFVKNYFRLDDCLQHIFDKICRDEYIKKAIEASKGLHIIRQDPWECLASYICATYKNIPAIRKMLANLSRKFGKKLRFDGFEFYGFPEEEKIAKAEVEELSECGLGYRAEYLLKTANMIIENDYDFLRLKSLSYEKAVDQLLIFPGVGNKVADCVLLFSLDKLEAFPVDVWIKRVILNFYGQNFPKRLVANLRRQKSLTPSQYAVLNLFGRRYFGAYAGYAQQYLYHYVRTRF